MAENEHTTCIFIRGASENNLTGFDLAIPLRRLTVVTGVSGSGKSSLVFDILGREGQRRYLESFSTYARQRLSRMRRPRVAGVEGLSPVIALGQKTTAGNVRSTVGTLTEIYDHLRLLYARLGTYRGDGPSPKLERSLFSFNSPTGACPACKGLGVEDRIDPELLVADPSKTLREGALVITTPTGYIIYSQVTLEVLNLVCEAHGFNVDIPWRDMTAEQKQIVLQGSDRIKIPYGKHPLESRMKWSGIKARPREEGVYKGILPVMEDILRRDRNKNILRFARSGPCSACGGRRLKPQALAVDFHGRSIAEVAASSVEELALWLETLEPEGGGGAVLDSIRKEILSRCDLLLELGLGYLTLDRRSDSLSGGEAQRIRLARQVGSELREVLYILDEPSIGLHAHDRDRLLKMLRRLVDGGNTVVVVEHEEAIIRAADHIVDIGPAAGAAGGRLLFSGTLQAFLTAGDGETSLSRTRAFLRGDERIAPPVHRRTGSGDLSVRGASLHNLNDLDVDLLAGAFNVLTGVSGAGKSSLLTCLRGQLDDPAAALQGRVNKVIDIDHSPIGRTPRSNAATYTGLFDVIRGLFAAEPAAKERGWGKGRFSFNVKGGRCEECQGAGAQRIGMHFLGDVDVPCETCGGSRFNSETLAVTYRGLNIRQVLDLPVSAALDLFEDQPQALRICRALADLGLGYLGLGQPSTTLSGGEAQRVKLATELCRPATGRTLYILDEPTTGLHAADVLVLLAALEKLLAAGNTVVAIEHDLDFIMMADRVVDLGPGSGSRGGRLLGAGTPEEIIAAGNSHTAHALAEHQAEKRDPPVPDTTSTPRDTRGAMELRGVATHNLRDIDVDIPRERISVITGVSGSGKSSLAFDTLFAEGQNRFAECYSTWERRLLGGSRQGELTAGRGLTPSIAISRRAAARNPRSTVGTVSEIHDCYRLLYSRVGVPYCPDCAVELNAGSCPACAFEVELPLTAARFSFNGHQGACPVCRGLGRITVCDPAKLVNDPTLSLLHGAMDGSKTGRFYGERDGQYLATLARAGEELNLDYSSPWRELTPEAQQVAMYGSGARTYSVTWRFRRKNRAGEHLFEGPWRGFAALVNDEYDRTHADGRGAAMLPLMKHDICPACAGARLQPVGRAVRFGGLTLAELSALSVESSLALFAKLSTNPDLSASALGISADLRSEITRRLQSLCNLGLSYLSLDRESTTLSGGEAQRLRLARQFGSGLRGVTYVLDEPTLGLHARDTERLLTLLRRLRDNGNTVVVVEHDEDVIRGADHLIELGPGGGDAGGRLVAAGTVADLINCSESPTGAWLDLPRTTPTADMPAGGEFLDLRGVSVNNLQDIDVALPVGALTVVTGVSGSGKTSLVFDALAASVRTGEPCGCREIGSHEFSKVLATDQSPLTGSVTSTIATYTGLFDPLRALFAATEGAQRKGLTKRHFSLGSKGGRCEACRGAGRIKVSLDFLADVWLVCEECEGKRFTTDVLACRWRGHSINEVLEMSIVAACDLLADEKRPAKGLAILIELGLGYLKLGQPTGTLSGGEAQRLKLAIELIGSRDEPALFLFDEPSAGLHHADIEKLLLVFARLRRSGHTLVVVEHNPQIIAAADHVLDLGPEGGDGGGRLMGCGTPLEIARNGDSATAELLRRHLDL
ncbi:MAG: excinuclease ABC subunit UvrA [bacterium]|nr:excinuclease ABC subunit UvrA [bacterium]